MIDGRNLLLLVLLSHMQIACRPGDDSSRVSSENPTFVDNTAEAGLSDFTHDNGARGNMYFPELMGSGGGFVDYNGDNWLDLLLVGGGIVVEDSTNGVQALRLFKNNTDGTFSEVTVEAGLGSVRAFGQGISAADFDNDGDEDFFFTTLHENLLFRNDGGVFSEVSEESGVSGRPIWSSSSLFFDPDRDGDLDLYVANYVDWKSEDDIFCSIQGVVILDTGGATNLEETYGQKVYCAPGEYSGIRNSFFQNNGDGTFQNRTEEAGLLSLPEKSLGVAEFDYDRDGWPDLFVANDGEPDNLYKNNGDGTFTEIGKPSGTALDDAGRARAGMGIGIGVVDDSGQETIFVGNFSSEMIGVYTYAGNGTFTDRAVISRIGQPSFLTLTFGLILVDFDYDTDLDLLAANGHVWAVRPTLDGSTYRQKAQLFVNRGDGVFDLAAPEAGGVLDKNLVARGASFGDFDRDGDVDVLITENGGPVHLWRNDLDEKNYLRVRLRGSTSNKEGLGAQLVAVSSGKRMHRRIRTGSSYLSQSEKVASFGLGSKSTLDSLVILWPSGQIDVLTDLEGNQEIEITEGQ